METNESKLLGFKELTKDDLKTVKATISFKEMLETPVVCSKKEQAVPLNLGLKTKGYLNLAVKVMTPEWRDTSLAILDEGISLGWRRWSDCIMTQIFTYLGKNINHEFNKPNKIVEKVAHYWDSAVSCWFIENGQLIPDTNFLVPSEVLDEFRSILKEFIDGSED